MWCYLTINGAFRAVGSPQIGSTILSWLKYLQNTHKPECHKFMGELERVFGGGSRWAWLSFRGQVGLVSWPGRWTWPVGRKGWAGFNIITSKAALNCPKNSGIKFVVFRVTKTPLEGVFYKVFFTAQFCRNNIFAGIWTKQTPTLCGEFRSK